VCLAEKILTASHLVDDDIDTCTMEESRNSNFFGTNGGGGASELAVIVDSEAVGSVDASLAIS